MSNKVKNIILIVLVILLFIALGIIIYLVKDNKEDNLQNIIGKVIIADKNYVMIETLDEDYLIQNIKGTYQVGDQVNFTYNIKDLNKNTSPKTIKISDEEIIKVNEEIQEDNNNDNEPKEDLNNEVINPNPDNNLEENNPSSNPSSNSSNIGSANNTSNSNPTNSTGNNGSNNATSSNGSNNTTGNNNPSSSVEPISADETVLDYFNSYKNNIDTSKTNNTLKSGFVTIVDFLFYNGTIRGHTFSDLTNTAKLKVLSLALYFDTKIEEYFPGYKESISSTVNKVYTNIKAKIVEAYLNITTKICTSNPEMCVEAKEGFTELKKNFSLTWDLIKDIAGDGITNLKNWYEIWRET